LQRFSACLAKDTRRQQFVQLIYALFRCLFRSNFKIFWSCVGFSVGWPLSRLWNIVFGDSPKLVK
jgi:hypothetical protein